MKVVKELIVRYEDGLEYKYTLGDDDYRLEEGRAHLKLWKGGCTHSTHYFVNGVKEYLVRNAVEVEGEEVVPPTEVVGTSKEVRIFFPSNPEVVYKNVSLKAFEDRVEISGDKVFAVFLLRDVSGWELRED